MVVHGFTIRWLELRNLAGLRDPDSDELRGAFGSWIRKRLSASGSAIGASGAI